MKAQDFFTILILLVMCGGCFLMGYHYCRYILHRIVLQEFGKYTAGKIFGYPVSDEEL